MSYIMYKYLYFKALGIVLRRIGFSGTPTNVLFSKAIVMLAFEDVRLAGCITTSTMVFPGSCSLYVVLMLDNFV